MKKWIYFLLLMLVISGLGIKLYRDRQIETRNRYFETSLVGALKNSFYGLKEVHISDPRFVSSPGDWSAMVMLYFTDGRTIKYGTGHQLLEDTAYDGRIYGDRIEQDREYLVQNKGITKQAIKVVYSDGTHTTTNPKEKQDTTVQSDKITEQQLNEFNWGKHVYSVNANYAQRNGHLLITDKKKHELGPNETNKIITLDHQEFQVLDVKDDTKTGFQGMAVAPIFNQQVDVQKVIVIASATDGEDWMDVKGAIQARNDPYRRGSAQANIAQEYVESLQKRYLKWKITHLSGYSQSAYMLQVGAKLEIPTVVFNGFYRYMYLTSDEANFMSKKPQLFKNYRHTRDLVTALADLNTTIGSGNDFGTIVWVEGSSHQIDQWRFDIAGNVIR